MVRPEDDEEPMVLGPEHILAEEEAPKELPTARILEADVDADAASTDDLALLVDDLPLAGGAPLVDVSLVDDVPLLGAAPLGGGAPLVDLPPVSADDRAPPDDEAPQLEAPPSDDLPSEHEAADDEAGALDTRNLRQLYELELRPLERDARLALAHRADATRLLALCLDPEPQVINAVFENAVAGLAHARMAARHHGTSVGLEMIAKRAQFLRDTQVQRALLHNGQATESLLRRVLGSRPLRDVYKACIDRELPSKNRAHVRNLMRARFSQAQSEERADLIVSTEGRCLAQLIGQTFDQHTTQLLCHRQYNSSLFIQNLARFSACPPLLLAHLLKQPFVRRQAQLRRLLLQHPNMPSQLKR